MSILDPPTNELERHLLNVVSHQLAYLSFYDPQPDKNAAWAPEFALDEVDED